jgi:hypothetical protein
MSNQSSEAPRLSDTQLAEVLALTKDADSVELKLTVPDPERRATVNALGIDVLDAQIRQIFFFSTPELVLNQRRGTRAPGAGPGDDSVIKLRPVVPHELPRSARCTPMSAGRRALVLPGRLADPRALHEMRTAGRLPGRPGAQGIPLREWSRPLRRTANENQGSTRVLRRQSGNRCRGIAAGMLRVAFRC